MGFAQENGYTPQTFEEIINDFRIAINAQFNLSYTEETFVGTNWYKYIYRLTQRVQEGEIKTSEIFQKLSQFISITNERIQRPSVSMPGLIDSFTQEGYIASVKPPADEDAGTISICVDLDDEAEDYEDEKENIANLIKDFVAAGLVSQGTEEVELTLSNGQNFDFKFFLPTRIPVLLRLTLVKSDNTLIAVPTDTEIRQALFDAINERYRLGWDFEPQRYFTQSDALWAASVLLEYSLDDGDNWASAVYEADFKDLFTFTIADIEVVIPL